MINYNSKQTQQIKELGAYLRQKRLENSLSLEQVASSTFIRLPILKAIEDGQVEELPELVYVQGFLRRYGEVLKLDGYTLSHQISPHTPETQPEIDPEFVAKHSIPDSTGEDLSSPTFRDHDQRPSESIKSDKPERSSIIRDFATSKFKVYGLYAALIGGAVAGLFYLLSRPPIPQSKIKNNQSEVGLTASKVSQQSAKKTNKSGTNKLLSSERPSPIVEAVSPTSNSSDSKKTTAKKKPENVVSTQTQSAVRSNLDAHSDSIQSQNNQTSQPVNPETSPSSNPTENSPVAAAVALEEDSWMQVKIDGKTEYEGILKKGEQQTWTAQKKLILRVGNAGAVKLSVNNQPGEKLGNLGEVKEVTLTPDN
ncbi:MAG TPA: DUF4115 domain-containing protein [Cyanothece sp. UBA12306]|nr:DUF4115 domain-containing protein [Cyanothece sp. UBA12306]